MQGVEDLVAAIVDCEDVGHSAEAERWREELRHGGVSPSRIDELVSRCRSAKKGVKNSQPSRGVDEAGCVDGRIEEINPQRRPTGFVSK